MVLSRAGVIVESSNGLTCIYRLKATEHLHINREKEKTNKRRKREDKLYAQQRHKQHACDLHVMQSRVLLKHFKTFLSLCYKNRFTITYSNISFPLLHPMFIYNFLWVVVPTHTFTHRKSYFSFQSLVGTICRIKSRKLPSDTSGG